MHRAEDNILTTYITLITNRKKTHLLLMELIYVQNLKLTDFYNGLGEAKLPPKPFKQLADMSLYNAND